MQFLSPIPPHLWEARADELVAQVAKFAKGRATNYIHKATVTVYNAVERIAFHVRHHGVKVVVVDYLGLLSAKGTSATERLANVTIELQRASRQHEIAIIALSQMNRDVLRRIDESGRVNFKPTDIMQSSQVFNDADNVLAVYWPWKVDQGQDVRDYCIQIMKCRRGENDRFLACKFFPDRCRVDIEASAEDVAIDAAMNSFDER